MKSYTNYLTLFLSIIFVLAGCSTPRLVNSSVERDSIVVHIRERDTVLYDTVVVEIARDMQSVETPVDSSHLENQFSISDARILPSGALQHTLETREQSIVAPTNQRVALRDSIIYHRCSIEQVEVREVEREFTRWQRFQMWGFWVLALAFVLVVALRR